MLAEDAIKYIMKFMVRNLNCLHHLTSELQDRTMTDARKSEVAALDVMDIDEAYKDGNITILEQFCKDTAKHHPLKQVCLN